MYVCRQVETNREILGVHSTWDLLRNIHRFRDKLTHLLCGTLRFVRY